MLINQIIFLKAINEVPHPQGLPEQMRKCVNLDAISMCVVYYGCV